MPPTSLRSSLWQSILITTVLFIGVGLVLYPAVGAYLSSHSFDDQVASYDSSVAGLDKATRKRMLAQARAYNARLNGSAGSAVRDPSRKAMKQPPPRRPITTTCSTSMATA